MAIGCLDGGGPPASATGVIIAVDGPSVAEVNRFTLRTDSGQLLSFRVGTLDVTGGGLAAPHLREHLVNGEPVTVTYAVEGGENVATRYVDATR